MLTALRRALCRHRLGAAWCWMEAMAWDLVGEKGLTDVRLRAAVSVGGAAPRVGLCCIALYGIVLPCGIVLLCLVLHCVVLPCLVVCHGEIAGQPVSPP